MQENDFGFVAPAQAPGVDEPQAPQKPEADPFAELAAPKQQSEAEEAAEQETFESLEREFEILAALRRERDVTKEVASEASEKYEAQRWRIGRAMEAQGTKQFKSAKGLGSCSRNERYTAKISDQPALIDWVKERHPELLTVNSQTLTRFVREEYRDKGVPIDDPSFPPGVLAGEQPNVTVTIPKKKKKE